MSKARVALGSILVFAIRAHAEAMAKILLEHKPNLLYQSCRGETALYCASEAGDLSMADLLVRQSSKGEYGIDVAEETRGWTPLIAACSNGHVEITRLLLQAGAKPDTPDIRGWTALEHAIFGGHHDLAETFLDKETPAPASTVLLSYVVAKPFPSLQKPSTSNQHRPENTFVQLVGHRGTLIAHGSFS
ncbi:Ankyrin repeat-containing domain protein [Metarhizium robertsii ARSEF 23]|nr:Ankyrin repeat-containing domain protein [Metarhizium robertsii ARSEF 23]EFY99365.2 Ankyrin repeat-containing domain protein [Metarhizium robertsii ARSEF 23]